MIIRFKPALAENIKFMKKITNKLIFGFLILLAGLFVHAGSAQASVSFISNLSASPSTTNSGDVVTVDITYRNTGDQTASNTLVRINPISSAPSTNFTIDGSVSSISGGNTASNTASISVSSAQTLSYVPGSAKWYPNQGSSQASFPFAQSGDEIMNGGVSIGSLAPGMSTAGHITLRFQVGSTVQNCQAQFNASSLNITSGNSVTLTWSVSGYTQISISGIYGNQSNTGSITLYPTSTTTYVLTATGGNCNPGVQTQSVTVNVNSIITSCQVSFNTSSYNIDSGNSVTLSWSVSGYNQITISGVYGNQSNSGSITLYPTSDTTYVLSATGGNCNPSIQTASVTVNVNSNQNDGPSITTNSAINVDENSATLRGYFDGNGSNTDTWFEYGTTSSMTQSTSQQSQGSGSGNFSRSISGLQSCRTYYFRAVGENSYGTDYGSTLTFQTDCVQQNSNLSVGTIGASSIGHTAARMNGVVYGNNGAALTWFEWGPTTSLGFTTTSQYVYSSTQSFSTPVFTLSPSTTYYFRAVAQNNDSGTVYGSIVPFTTLAASSQVVVISNGGGSAQFVELSIVTPNQSASMGDTVSYTVTYKNISSGTLRNVALNVMLSKDLDFTSATNGIFGETNHALQVNIGTLPRNESGTVFIQGVVNNSARDNDLAIATATIAFTTASGAQDDAIAYATTNINSGTNSLAGLALFGSGFLPSTLVGWLLLILVILALVALARRYYGPRVPPAI